MTIDFAERRRKFLEDKALSQNKPPPGDVPDLGPSERPDSQLDEIIDRIGVLEAYEKWCGKKVDERTLNKREGVKVSCPKPDHPDHNPSAWLNLDDDLWFCGGCQLGGDKYDIAAYHFGFDVPGYKDGSNFHKLRRVMAEDLGYRIQSDMRRYRTCRHLVGTLRRTKGRRLSLTRQRGCGQGDQA